MFVMTAKGMINKREAIAQVLYVGPRYLKSTSLLLASLGISLDPTTFTGTLGGDTGEVLFSIAAPTLQFPPMRTQAGLSLLSQGRQVHLLE